MEVVRAALLAQLRAIESMRDLAGVVDARSLRDGVSGLVRANADLLDVLDEQDSMTP